jgi:hypothetical protein
MVGWHAQQKIDTIIRSQLWNFADITEIIEEEKVMGYIPVAMKEVQHLACWVLNEEAQNIFSKSMIHSYR